MSLGLRQQQIRTTASSVLVLNLAIADLFYSVLCLPFIFTIYLIIFRSDLDLEAPLAHGFENKCQFSAFFRYTTCISEWTTIGLMALEKSNRFLPFRFITISRYARWQKGGYRWFTPKKSACYCLLIWILSICMQMPTLLEVGAFFGKFGYNVDTIKCDFVSSEGQSFGMRDFFFLMEAPIPCALILVGYIAIIVRIKSSTRFMKKFG
ncbi:allatostatin-A receptor-like [Hyalella azteca]|uniref:Allatostatin-A receptor-like n=1 Tax=Hyalella azteca TaxID=294128 RepID=A0A979FXQ5_HYAAZ|nr:allatostatin-A receptor-like [Hyalella azteca]